MQILSANDLIDTLGMNAAYNFGSDVNKVSMTTRPLNMRERSSLQVQRQPEIKLDSRREQSTNNERIIISQTREMSFNNNGQELLKSQPSRTNSPAVFASESCAAIPSVFIDPEAPEREYFLRCVVLGSENTGKHTLISSNTLEEPVEHSKTGADFIAKKTVTFKTTKKYHFWVRTLGDNSVTKEAVWKTYYKWANAFVFVYDINNKESFEALQKAVESVLEVVPRDKFFGVLVGNKNELHTQRAVSYDEAVDFKLRYSFSHFIETCNAIEKEMPQILPRLDNKLKLTFESI